MANLYSEEPLNCNPADTPYVVVAFSLTHKGNLPIVHPQKKQVLIAEMVTQVTLILRYRESTNDISLELLHLEDK
jgi:hypothetical protein